MSEQDVFDTLKYRIEVDRDGTRRYYDAAGQYHRDDGPAIEWANGHKEWWQNDKLHRVDGPAVELVDGSKVWYQHGQRHRVDGPAVEYASGSKEWWLNGEEMSEYEFKQLVKLL